MGLEESQQLQVGGQGSGRKPEGHRAGTVRGAGAGYHDSLCLTENARLVLTDSGGLQEESTFFRTPCLTLRPNTERPVTLSLGSNRLTSLPQLRSDIESALDAAERIGRIPPLWDGHAADRVLARILDASTPACAS